MFKYHACILRIIINVRDMFMQVFCIQIFLLLNVLSFAGIVLLTQLLTRGSKRVVLLGWICVGFSVSVFAAPLSVIVSAFF